MLSPIMIVKLAHKFHLVDTDRDGRISGLDYARLARDAARGLAIPLESERFTALEAKWKTHWSDTLAHANSSRADELSLGEYLDAEAAGLADLEHHRVEYARMTRIMADAMDPEGTGRITSRIYKAVFGAYSLSGEQIDAAFGLMVPGRDFMTRAEFERYADEFFSSDDPQALGNNFFGIPGWGRTGELGLTCAPARSSARSA